MFHTVWMVVLGFYCEVLDFVLLIDLFTSKIEIGKEGKY